jgi:hypothetical protein
MGWYESAFFVVAVERMRRSRPLAHGFPASASNASVLSNGFSAFT